MSFSFSITASSPKAAKSAVAARLAEVCVSQPAHCHHLLVIIKTANAYIDLVEHQDGETIAVSMSGSVGWTATGFNCAGISISVNSFTAF